MISIAIATPEASAYRVQAFEGPILVGRDAHCNLVLGARGVSGTHCRLSPMAGLQGAYMLEDLGSKYGTFVNRQRVSRPVVVSGRDVITVGGHELLLAERGQEHAAVERLKAHCAPQPEPAPVAPAPAPTTAGPVPNFDPSAPWMRQFAYFDDLARAWHEHGRPKSKLLVGRAVAVAEQWLAAGVRQSPTPGALHRDFIERSRNRRSGKAQGVALVTTFAVLGVAGGAGWYVFGDELGEALEPPPEITATEDDTEVEARPVAAIDLSGLVDESRAIAQPDTRLLVQAAILDAAHAQNLPTTSSTVWTLSDSAHAELAKLREVVLAGHDKPISRVDFDPTGRWLASGSDDGSSRLWDLQAATTNSITVRGSSGAVTGLGFSPNGKWLATAEEAGGVWRWDMSAADPGGTGVAFSKHEGAVRHLAWHPSGRFLVSGDDEGRMVVWDLEAPPESAATVSRFVHEGAITALLFDGGEQTSLYSGSDDRSVRRWTLGAEGGLSRRGTFDELAGGVISIGVSVDHRWIAASTTAQELWLWQRPSASAKKRKARTKEFLLEGHTGVVESVVFTPDSKQLVSAGDDGTLRLWDMTVDDPSIGNVALEGEGEVSALALAVDGARAVSAGTDNTVRVWDLVQARRVVEKTELAGHTDAVDVVDVSPDGLSIATGSRDTTVRIWDALGRSAGRGGRLLRVGARPVLDMDVGAAGRVVAVSEGRTTLWSVGGDERPRAVDLSGAKGVLNAVTFDGSGRLVAGAAETGAIYLWAVGPKGAEEPRELSSHTESVNALAFTPDGKKLISASSDRTLRVWSLANLEEPQVWSGHADEVRVLVLAEKTGTLFSGGLDGSIIRWSLADGSSTELRQHEGEITRLALSPDGGTLASASTDRRVHVWDADTGKHRHTLRGHTEAVNAVAFSRDGKLASAGVDAAIRIWDLKSEYPDERPRVLDGHAQTVTDLVFIGDGSMLASSSNDGTVRLWRVETGDSIPMPGHDGVVSQLRLTPNEDALLSSGFDGSLRQWPLSSPALAKRICESVGRGLTKEESVSFFGRVVADPCKRGR